jgi:hypothetical protein
MNVGYVWMIQGYTALSSPIEDTNTDQIKKKIPRQTKRK